MNEKTESLFHNEEFMKRVLTLSPAEAQKEFEKAGGSVTVEELEAIGAEANKILQQKKDGELDVTALENVAGGKSTAKTISEYAWGIAAGAATYGWLILGW